MPTDLRPRLHREVTSFVRRSARMRDSQRRAYEAQLGGIVLDVPQGPLRTSVADDAAALDLPRRLRARGAGGRRDRLRPG